jgi:hypothetical protein
MGVVMFIQEQQDVDKKEQQQALKRNRVSSLSNVFSRALSVLTGRKIAINVVDRQEVKTPAWSSTNEVWLNLAEIKDDFTPRSIVSLNGLSFHELGHLRYTARNGSNLVKRIQAEQQHNELWEAFNCLEDSRIEMLLVGYLPSIENWLIATMVDYLLSDEDTINRAFPLVYGRKYLPLELRQLATDKFVNQSDLQELSEIIDTYCSLIITGNNENSDLAFDLIKRFSELLDNLPQLPPQGGEGGEGKTIVRVRIKNPNGHGHRPTEGLESSSHRPATTKEQERDKNNSQKRNKGDVVIDVVIDNSSKEDSQDNNQQSQSKSSQPKQSQPNTGCDFGDNDLPIDDDFDVKENTSDNQSSSTGNQSSSSKTAGDTDGTTGSNSQVSDVLNNILEDVIDDLSKEIKQIANQLGITSELDGGNAKEPKKATYLEKQAPQDLVLTSRAFGRELERLRSDFDPAWVRYQDSGKINVSRYFRGDDMDTIFDEWSEGRDDVCDIEAVILLDRSGSMSGSNADNAYKSMWAIKKALERVNARTTVCVFDHHTELLYGADETAGTTIRDSGADGGTDPHHSLMYAKRVLAETEKPIRILFMITDGAWDTKEGEQAVIEMKEAGVITCQALITGSDIAMTREQLENYRHSFELMTSIKSAKDLIVLGKELVRLSIARQLTNA